MLKRLIARLERRACALVTAALLALAGGAAAGEGALVARAVALGGAAAAATVTVTFDRAPAFTLHTLDDPPRVVVDLPLTDWRIAAPAPQAGLARGLRFGLAAPGRSRLVVDLGGPAAATATLAPSADGVALTLTVRAQDAAAFAAQAQSPPPRAAAPARRALTVAIDPGHGGADPGASHGALQEKTLTLAHAQALRTALEARGWRAVLTREDDAFVGLAARVARARAMGADVLVSLHADAVPQPEVAGVSIYTLSVRASDADAAALASRENRADLALAMLFPGVESDVAHVLAPHIQRETAAASARLGAVLVAALASQPLLPGRPLRAAGFQVLRAPDIPAVLIELGFLSSAEDRARLTDPAGTRAAAEAIAAGLAAWADAPAPQDRAE